jgi:hypothetical protein
VTTGQARSNAPPIVGELVQCVGVFIILGAVVWGLVGAARLFSAVLIVGYAWWFFGRWLRRRSGVP